MSNLGKYKQGIIGFMVGSIFFSSMAFAATTQNIEVSFDKLRFVINGVDKTTSDGEFDNNGTKVPASLIYQGTTYIPMRMVSNMFGKPIEWDGRNSTILIGDASGDSDKLMDLNPAKSSGNIYLNQKMTLKEQEYNEGIHLSGTSSIEYNLDGKYKQLTGLMGLSAADNRQSAFSSGVDVTITGDGKKIWSSAVLQGVNPFDMKIDVAGVLKLNIEIKPKGLISNLYFVNPTLTKK